MLFPVNKLVNENSKENHVMSFKMVKESWKTSIDI